MRRKENKNTYCILSAILCGAMLIGCSAGDGMTAGRTGQNEVSERAQDEKQFIEGEEDLQRPGETYRCSMQELTSYLLGYVTDCPFVSADIMISGYSGEAASYDDWNLNISFTGNADVTWQFYDSLEQMEDALQARTISTEQNADEETDSTESGDNIRLLYYTFPLPEDTHALDIYQTLKELYDTEEHSIVALSGGNGNLYYFTQGIMASSGYALDHYYTSPINLVIKDGFAYGLILQNTPASNVDEKLDLLFSDYLDNCGRNLYPGWALDEEKLYWIDHEERITELENPTRRFVEIRAIDTERAEMDNGGVMRYVGMLKEADYEVLIYDKVPMLEISFSFAKEPLEAGYETPLYYGRCMDEKYHMTVTDKESGEVLQEDTVYLSIEEVDMITFGDLNKDRYQDMQIDMPAHQDMRYVTKHWDFPSYMLWNTELEIFEHKTEREVRGSLHAHINMITEEGSREYVVQPGDCLWSISARFLGSGSNWTMLKREKNASEDPNYVLPGEIVYIPNGINFP